MPALLEGFDVSSRPRGTFIALNDTVNFQDVRHQTTSFDLMRIKLNIDVTLLNGCVFHAPAELIDVTFSNKDDSKMISSQGESIEHWAQVRTFSKGGMHVYIPTLKYLVHDDLGAILFKQSPFPWHAPKYEKRLARFIVGCFLLSMGDDSVLNTEPKAKRWAWKCGVVKLASEKAIVEISTTGYPQGQQQGGNQGAPSDFFVRPLEIAAYRQFSIMKQHVKNVRDSVYAVPSLHENYNVMIQAIMSTMVHMNNHLEMLVHTRKSELNVWPENATVFQALFVPQR